MVKLKFHTVRDELDRPALAAEVLRLSTREPETIMAGSLGLISQWLRAKNLRHVPGTNGIWSDM